MDPVERPSTSQTYLDICNILKLRSTCTRAQHAAVLVGTDGHVVSMGYNGSPHGQPHCTDVGCLMDGGHCVSCLHAEENMLLFAPVERSRGGTVYITSIPCFRCATRIVQAGVKQIVYDGRNAAYATDAHLRERMLQMFETANVTFLSFSC